MTEERVNAILEQVRLAEKVMCSVPGWRGETSDVIAESSGLPGSEEGSPDSLADSLEQPPAQTSRLNGGHTDAAREGKAKEARKKGFQEDSSTAGPSRGRGREGSVRPEESGSDEETTVTTRVYRRRVILKGKKRGKRSRQGHKAEKSGEEAQRGKTEVHRRPPVTPHTHKPWEEKRTGAPENEEASSINQNVSEAFA
ncbi:ankyrin-3-like isoform X1 [Lates japonicus]|uniref:Ankyrin-3-like isoform X1 n=1 Tax=Lates japonicus TaxID=270547 RepID=A0AAD3NGW2_LATJO|nr:ankyrin-3-like isoform X1 [Lates japonicus]